MPEVDKRRWIIVLIGPPGAGKGTQADLLAEDFGLFHLETSKIVEEKLKGADSGDKELVQAKVQYDAGKLVNPEFVASWVIGKIRQLAVKSQGIVFSGSFRTLYEAKTEIPICQELYGKNNIFIFNIEIEEEESVVRNSGRRICKANRHPIPRYAQADKCPRDGSELIVRSLDNSDTIRVRYKTYLEDTKPVLDYLKQEGYTAVKINGARSIEAVHDDITHALHGLHTSMHLDILKKD